MKIFSALLVLLMGNYPVTGEFPTQRPVTWSFDVFFNLRLNLRLSKQSLGWWFETPSRSLWRHCNKALGQSCHCFSSPQVTVKIHWRMLYIIILIFRVGSDDFPSAREVTLNKSTLVKSNIITTNNHSKALGLLWPVSMIQTFLSESMWPFCTTIITIWYQC